MQHFVNDPDTVIDDYLDGMVTAHPSTLERIEDTSILRRADDHTEETVGVVTGCGGGHEPALSGYVGPGMLDGVAVGDIFTAPTADQISMMLSACDTGAGVLAIVANFEGDKLNFDAGIDLATVTDDPTVERVIVDDDVATRDTELGGRGVCGMVLVIKAAGASAARGDSLDEVTRIAQKATDNVATFGVGLSSCTLPGETEPIREIPADTVEYGIGVHGETSAEHATPETASEVARRLTDEILEASPIESGDTVVSMVNGMGATPLGQLYILNDALQDYLGDHAIETSRQWVGEYATTLDTSGCSITLLRVDDELEALMNAPARSPGLSVVSDSDVP